MFACYSFQTDRAVEQAEFRKGWTRWVRVRTGRRAYDQPNTSTKLATNFLPSFENDTKCDERRGRSRGDYGSVNRRCAPRGQGAESRLVLPLRNCSRKSREERKSPAPIPQPAIPHFPPQIPIYLHAILPGGMFPETPRTTPHNLRYSGFLRAPEPGRTGCDASGEDPGSANQGPQPQEPEFSFAKR